MPETITLHALDLSGETTLKLFLRKDDGTLLNASGDALTEISSSGVFAATLAEDRTGLGTLAVRVCDGTETADNLLIDDFLPESSTVIGATVRAELDSATRVKLDATQPDYAPATPAQVNAQVLDVLSVDTFAELSAPPAATSSLKDKITWLFMYARNKVTQTATTRTLYRDDTTTVAGTSTTSDNGTTFTKGEDA